MIVKEDGIYYYFNNGHSISEKSIKSANKIKGVKLENDGWFYFVDENGSLNKI